MKLPKQEAPIKPEPKVKPNPNPRVQKNFRITPEVFAMIGELAAQYECREGQIVEQMFLTYGPALLAAKPDLSTD